VPREIARVRASVVVLLVLAAACQRAAVSERPDAAPGAAPREAFPGAHAVASVVASVRSRELRLGAPAWQLQPLAFGRGLLVRLMADRVEAIAVPNGERLFEHPLDDPRGAVEIAGGSVVVVAAGEALRIDPGSKEPVRLPPVPFLPGTVLVPDRKDSQSLWSVHSAGRVLARQSLSISGKRALGVVPLLEYDGGPVTATRDGALLYRGEGGVRRSLSGGRPVRLNSKLVPWRLLPGRRVDQAWAVAEDGAVELWQIGERILVLSRFALGAAPFDVVASSQYFAAVVVEEGSGGPRRFRLVVFSEKGNEVLKEDLGTDSPAEGERWTALSGRDRHVALGDPEPLVAVGGPGSVRVLALPGGGPVFAR
jgi:hypothetical protein